MNETIALLVTAHLVADFTFQTNWMVRHKKNLFVLMLHILIVTVMAGLAVGHWNHPLLWIVAGTHLAIDLMKTFLLRDILHSFLLDQALHVSVIIVGSYLYFNCAQTGLWMRIIKDPTQQALLFRASTVVSGIILCIQVGGVLVAKTVKPLLSPEQFEHLKGVPNGGRVIGYLERTLVMLLTWIGQPAGIGFLVTAKSILRFGDIKDSANRQITEYVIIGTFLSFGWAIFVTALTQRVWQLW